MKKTHAFIFALSIAAVSLTGCTTVNTVASDSGKPGYNSVPTRKVITDDSLNGKVRVVDIREARNSSDLLRISVELINPSNARKAFNYRIDWLDGDGMSITTLMTSWKTKSLAGKETGFITAIAPTPKAADFRLQLVETKR